MKRRDGSSLVEVLIALGILVGGLLVAYILLQNSFLGFRRLDRRQTAEAISLNIQDRYFHTESSELMDRFGSPTGGRNVVEEDALVLQTLPLPLDELKKLGFQIDAFAVGLDQGNGSTGIYFTTKVSWPATGGRQFVTHSRVVASGVRGAQLASEVPAPTPAPEAGKLLSLSVAGNVEAYGQRAAAVAQALAGKGRSAELVFEGSAKVMDAMAVQPPSEGKGNAGAASTGAASPGGSSGSSARGSSAGVGPSATGGGAPGAGSGSGFGGNGGGSGASGSFGLNAGTSASAHGGDGSSGSSGSASRSTSGDGATRRTRRTGSATDGEDWDDAGEVITASGTERRSGGGGRAHASADAGTDAMGRTAARKPRAGAPAAGEGAAGVALESELMGTTADPIDFLLAAAPQLTAEERARLVPGKATTEAELAKLWGPLESRRVPPGIYRYNTQSYIHVTATRVFRYEVLTLQADGSSEKFPLISRRELTGGQVTGAYLEGAEVLERRMLAVRGVAPGGPTVAPGVSAILERCAQRLYVTRPVLLPDGSVAPFGREIAVLAWEGSESGELEGSQGKNAREEISKQWVLGEPEKREAQAALGSSAGAAAASFTSGSYQEKVETPRARLGQIEEVAVTWANTRSRDAAPRVEADAPTWKSSQSYAQAIEAINANDYKAALGLVEQLRTEAGTPRLELERLYASILVQLERWDEAAGVYGAAARAPEADASLHNNLAFVEMHRGNAAGALAAASQALQKDPGHLTAAVNAGIANEMLGKHEEAIAAYRAGLVAHPGAPSLVEGLRRMGASDR